MPLSAFDKRKHDHKPGSWARKGSRVEDFLMSFFPYKNLS
jgi:hypothetical protein